MRIDARTLRALLLVSFVLCCGIVVALAGRPSREPEIFDWWSVRAAAVWSAAVCALALAATRLRWLLGPRGTRLLIAVFRGLRSSHGLWLTAALTPLVAGVAALAWLHAMGVPFDAPLQIGLACGAGISLIFEVLLATVGRERHPA